MKNCWYFNLKVFVPCILIWIALALSYCETVYEGITAFLTDYGLGVVGLWTFMEYFQHRFVLHTDARLDPNEPYTEAVGERNARLFTKHIHHHVFMNQRNRIPVDQRRLWGYLIGYFAIFPWFIPMKQALLLIAGTYSGNLIYDWVHLMFHFPDMYQLPFGFY